MSAKKCAMILDINPTFVFPSSLFVNTSDNTVSSVKPTVGTIYEYTYVDGGYSLIKSIQPPPNTDAKYKDLIFTNLLSTFRQTKSIMLPIDGMYLQGENGLVAFGNK